MKPIPGFNGYFADEFGNIYSNKTHSSKGKTLEHPRIMSQSKNWRGYKMVNFTINGKTKYIAVHLLILKTFVSERPTGMLGCHGKNGISDNSVNNLYWASAHENNLNDKLRDGTLNHGENNYRTKLKKENVLFIRKHFSPYGKNGMSGRELAKMFSVKPCVICAIAKRKSWIHTF